MDVKVQVLLIIHSGARNQIGKCVIPTIHAKWERCSFQTGTLTSLA